MNAFTLQKELTDWSIKNSGYDEHRNYIGLSVILDCPRIIYRRFFNHTGMPMELRLRTRYSYEVEEIIKNRFKAIEVYSKGKEISIYDGLVKGHTDGEIQTIDPPRLVALLEIKTVPATDHIPKTFHEIPRKVIWQAQAYMLYGYYNLTFCFYFARESGLFRIFEIRPDPEIRQVIIKKVDYLVKSVTLKELPICECGKCL